MAEKGELATFFRDLLDRIPGLQGVLVSDEDGVPLVQVYRDSSLRDIGQPLAAAFSASTDQAGKLKMGKNKSIVTFTEGVIVVHINHLPLIITFLTETEANIGAILGISSELQKLLEPLRTSLSDMEAGS
eukprot:TRINITY_DN12336_c0_g1_i1.p1 TRINITY_DN12336_c0_g1~~TRINITY_DN12336_c0_g1_i1.p1  ORF type:complete len:142 (-),score=35.21 TRINITY_DN12336_c0_g1_i1:33-422(-)